MCVMLVAVFHIPRCGFMLFYLVLFSFSSFISRVSVHESTFILGLASHPSIFYFFSSHVICMSSFCAISLLVHYSVLLWGVLRG